MSHRPSESPIPRRSPTPQTEGAGLALPGRCHLSLPPHRLHPLPYPHAHAHAPDYPTPPAPPPAEAPTLPCPGLVLHTPSEAPVSYLRIVLHSPSAAFVSYLDLADPTRARRIRPSWPRDSNGRTNGRIQAAPISPQFESRSCAAPLQALAGRKECAKRNDSNRIPAPPLPPPRKGCGAVDTALQGVVSSPHVPKRHSCLAIPCAFASEEIT